MQKEEELSLLNDRALLSVSGGALHFHSTGRTGGQAGQHIHLRGVIPRRSLIRVPFCPVFLCEVEGYFCRGGYPRVAEQTGPGELLAKVAGEELEEGLGSGLLQQFGAHARDERHCVYLQGKLDRGCGSSTAV